MIDDNTITSLNEQNDMDNDPTLRYFTAIRQQEPEYADITPQNGMKSVVSLASI